MTCGLVIALVLGLIAWLSRNEAIEQRNRAERQADIALARQLAAQAGRMTGEQENLLPRAVLLGVESMRRIPSREADQALREGLTLLPRRSPTLMNHEDDVLSVAFSPNGRYLATASLDDTARVWETTTGDEVAVLDQKGPVVDVAFSRSGRYVATAGGMESGGGFAEISVVRSEDLIAEACSRLSRNLTRQEWEQYLGDVPHRKTCPSLPQPA